jgi:hypothetical protein
MTKIDPKECKKTWRVAEGGSLLGTIDIISPWTGSPTEAVVNTETGDVIAAHGATCAPFQLVVPNDLLKGMPKNHVGGIRYPGDDGSEPEDVREAKAQAYADEVLAKADAAAGGGQD